MMRAAIRRIRTMNTGNSTMSKHSLLRRALPAALVASVGLTLGMTASAQVLDRSIDTENQITRNAAQVQSQINQVADQTDDIVAEYRALLTEIDSLRIYNDQLQRVVNNQREEITQINEDLANLEATNRDVVPLMIEMAEMLPQLIEADVPFRLDERLNRARFLIGALDLADVTTSEKYRRILEAYLDEIELGRTTEGYRGQLPTGQSVDFLRVGRTLLFYQSLDGTETGWWNPNSRAFEQLDDSYRLPVSDGLAIAQNQVAPDLVRLPVPAPESE